MASQPNFLFLITDQHRADHLGCYGNRIVRTPLGLHREQARPAIRNRTPERTIADALAAYGEAHGSTTRRPDLIRIAILRLLDFYGDNPVTTVTEGVLAEVIAPRIVAGNVADLQVLFQDGNLAR